MDRGSMDIPAQALEAAEVRYDCPVGFDYSGNLGLHGRLTGAGDSCMVGDVMAHAIVATPGVLYLEGDVDPGAQIICKQFVHKGRFESEIPVVRLEQGDSFEAALARADRIQLARKQLELSHVDASATMPLSKLDADSRNNALFQSWGGLGTR